MLHLSNLLKARAAIVASGAVLGLLMAVLLNMVARPAVLREEPPGPDFAYGLFNRQTAPDGTIFRWTGSHATITLPYAANSGRIAHISLRMAANRALGQQPAEVSLGLNGKPSARFTARNGFWVYTATLDTLRVPNPYLDPANVQIDLDSSTTSTPQNKNQVGVALDWIEIRPERSRTEIALEGAIWFICLATLLLITTTFLNKRWSLAYGLAALITLSVVHLTYVPRAIPLNVEVLLAGLAWVFAAWVAPKERPIWGFGLAACCLWLVTAGRLLGDWELDDAYISYRYAWNLAHGHGLVYNVGEVVEGYTNFLWTMLSALVIALGFHPTGAALAATIALSLGIVALTFHLSKRLAGSNYYWSLLVVVLLSVDIGLISYGARGSGMEAALFAFCVLAAVALLWSGQGEAAESWRPLGGVMLALAALTRPEGLVVAFILIMVRVWQDRKPGRNLFAILLPFLIIVAPYQAWRLLFYGYPFPNTFYAKTGASLALIGRGLAHVWYFAQDHWFLSALAVVYFGFWILDFGLVGVMKFRHKVEGPKSKMVTALFVLVLAYTLYIIWVGGDYFPGWRFFVPLLAPMVLLSQQAMGFGLAHLPSGGVVRRAAIAVLVASGAIYVIDSLWLERPNDWLAEHTRLQASYIEKWGSAGLWLRDNTPPGAWTAARGAGAIAYYSERPVVDMQGLNDLHIGHLNVANMGEGKVGHEKQDPAYVLSRQPEYILAEWEPYFQPVKEQFDRDYEYQTVRSPVGRPVEWWRRKAVGGRQ